MPYYALLFKEMVKTQLKYKKRFVQCMEKVLSLMKCIKVVFEILCWRLSLDDAPWSSKPVEVDSSQIKTLIENSQCYTTLEMADILKHPNQALKIICTI